MNNKINIFFNIKKLIWLDERFDWINFVTNLMLKLIRLGLESSSFNVNAQSLITI